MREAADHVGAVLEELIKEETRLTERPDIKPWIISRYENQTRRLTQAVNCLKDISIYLESLEAEVEKEQNF